MRKLLALFCGLMFLTACTHRSVQPIVVDFSCTFAGEYEGLAIEGELCREGIGTLSISFTSPETVKGLRFLCENGNTQLLLDQLVYPVGEALPVDALPSVLLFTLDNALLTNTASEQNVRTPSGEVCTVKVDTKTGFVCMLQSQGRFLLRFENMKKTGSQ